MLLTNKNAVVYGGGGAIGGAVARAFASEGARVFLAGRSRAKLDAVVQDISAAGGRAEAAVLDALDEQAVNGHAQAVAEQGGRIDIALNAVGILHVQGTPLAELSYDEFAHPLHAYARTNFLTARAVGLQMTKQRSGVIFTLSTPGSRLPVGAGYLGIGTACAATESLTRHMAAELGPSGVRVICLRPDAIPEAVAQHSHSEEVFGKAARAAGITIEALLAQHQANAPLLRRLPTLAEVANMAAFLASDQASAMTGAIVNLTCGSMVDF